MHHLAIKFWWENNSRLNYMHHNIKCKVKLGVWDINFRGKYKVIINIMKHLKWEVLISPKQFLYPFEKRKKNQLRLTQKKLYFRFASG